MRSLLGEDSRSSTLESNLKIDPSRSPFIRERIDVVYEGYHLQNLVKHVVVDGTFKVIFIQNSDVAQPEKFDFKERQRIEP
jgi:hypothetical protein